MEKHIKGKKIKNTVRVKKSLCFCLCLCLCLLVYVHVYLDVYVLELVMGGELAWSAVLIHLRATTSRTHTYKYTYTNTYIQKGEEKVARMFSRGHLLQLPLPFFMYER